MTSLEYYGQLCKQYPELIFYLFTLDLSAQFEDHCQKQFKHEWWDCKNIDRIPLFKATSAFLTLGECCITIYGICMHGHTPHASSMGE